MPGVAFCFSAVIIFMFVTGNFLFPCNRIFPLGKLPFDINSANISPITTTSHCLLIQIVALHL